MMFDSILALALIIATIGAGLMTGVYFAFSGFIMRSLDQLGAARAADAMNAINKIILRSWFMVLFFGSTLVYAVLAVVALLVAELDGRWLLFTTGLIYVGGMFLCTALFNVPLNNRLAAAGGDESVKAKTWPFYLERWTRWNHLRTVCSLTTVVLGGYYLVRYI